MRNLISGWHRFISWRSSLLSEIVSRCDPKRWGKGEAINNVVNSTWFVEQFHRQRAERVQCRWSKNVSRAWEWLMAIKTRLRFRRTKSEEVTWLGRHPNWDWFVPCDLSLRKLKARYAFVVDREQSQSGVGPESKFLST